MTTSYSARLLVFQDFQNGRMHEASTLSYCVPHMARRVLLRLLNCIFPWDAHRSRAIARQHVRCLRWNQHIVHTGTGNILFPYLFLSCFLFSFSFMETNGTNSIAIKNQYTIHWTRPEQLTSRRTKPSTNLRPHGSHYIVLLHGSQRQPIIPLASWHLWIRKNGAAGAYSSIIHVLHSKCKKWLGRAFEIVSYCLLRKLRTGFCQRRMHLLHNFILFFETTNRTLYTM